MTNNTFLSKSLPTLFLLCLAFLTLSIDAFAIQKSFLTKPLLKKRVCKPKNPTQNYYQGGTVQQVTGGPQNTVLTTTPTNTGANTTTTTGGGGGGGGGGGALNFPSGCVKTSAGIGIGVDYDGSAAGLVGGLGGKPCVLGHFYNMDDWAGLSGAAAQMASDAKATGSILMLSLKPSNFDYPDNAIASVAQTLNNLGVPVWLRLGWEMTMLGPEKTYPNNPAGYVTMWNKFAGQVNRQSVLMYWCMNAPIGGSQSWDNLDSWAKPWYPGDKNVDITGLDTYGATQGAKLTDGLSNQFCSSFGTKPIFIGETSTFDGQSGSKSSWAAQLVDPSTKQRCPAFAGFAWFEYVKEVDFTGLANGIVKGALGDAQSGGVPTS